MPELSSLGAGELVGEFEGVGDGAGDVVGKLVEGDVETDGTAEGKDDGDVVLSRMIVATSKFPGRRASKIWLTAAVSAKAATCCCSTLEVSDPCRYLATPEKEQ